MTGWLLHWLAVHTGTVGEAGPYYGFFSGFGSIILPPFLDGLVFAALFWWHHQCAVHGCWWYARRTTAAGERACWKHHPHKKRTADDVHAAHHAARRAQVAGKDVP